MSDYSHCNLCDEKLKYKSKKQHLNSQYHQILTNCINSRYFTTNQSFLDIEDILKKHVYD